MLEEVLLESDLVFLTGVAGEDAGLICAGGREAPVCGFDEETGIGLEWGREGSGGGG